LGAKRYIICPQFQQSNPRKRGADVNSTNHPNHQSRFLVLLLVPLAASLAHGQTDPEDLSALLKDEILSPAVAEFQIRQYLIEHVAAPPRLPSSPQEWTSQAARLRHHLLEEVAFHGWPREWVEAGPKFEEVGVIETGAGYRIRKLRYEIVPGFESAALLYEPEHLSGKVPAILNLNGHVGPPGKAVEYKQKRCINFARHGVLALNLEWFYFGELEQKGNDHWFGAHLDLVGANELGLFILEMRKGLDFLSNHPSVDRARIGVTGLSGGGWQTITLSALDERVRAANPVAGFSSLRSRVEAKRYGDLGDVEQSATDFLAGSDFPHLVALMAPRPILLTYNAEDNCCFRAGLVKPLVYDAMQPFFKLYRKEDAFEWHENRDPATHNYQLDNRLADYRFFSRQFGLPPIDNEDHLATEVRSYEELRVGLPEDNLTILGLAQKLGRAISRPPVPSEPAALAAWSDSERTKLREVARAKPVRIERVWSVATTKSKDLQTTSYLFQLSNGLSASGVWLRSILQSSDSAPVTIVLDDNGREAAAAAVSDRVNRGEQVLALDLMFTASSWKDNPPFQFVQLLHGLGDRPLGMEAAQLSAIARWAKERAGVSSLRLEPGGIRTQVISLVAAALDPALFSALAVRSGMHSLSYVLQAPVQFEQAPELFCLDFYKEFDLDRLEALAAPAKVSVTRYLEIPNRPAP
jgi:dienelactone hydrolase